MIGGWGWAPRLLSSTSTTNAVLWASTVDLILAVSMIRWRYYVLATYVLTYPDYSQSQTYPCSCIALDTWWRWRLCLLVRLEHDLSLVPSEPTVGCTATWIVQSIIPFILCWSLVIIQFCCIIIEIAVHTGHWFFLFEARVLWLRSIKVGVWGSEPGVKTFIGGVTTCNIGRLLLRASSSSIPSVTLGGEMDLSWKVKESQKPLRRITT